MDLFDYAGCNVYAQPLRDACVSWGVTPASFPYLLAQLSVESGGFRRIKESMNYHADTLLRVCHGRNGINTIDDATAAVMRGPSGVAEALYGGEWGAKNLGNKFAGDGFSFIGRGLIQTTGRYNYGVTSHRVHGDDRYLTNPELLTVAFEAAQAACSYWMEKRLNGVTDVVAITRAINGGLEAVNDRQAETRRLLAWAP